MIVTHRKRAFGALPPGGSGGVYMPRYPFASQVCAGVVSGVIVFLIARALDRPRRGANARLGF